ncbi:MAG: hypothetical protein D3920_05275 [Candidatus Electrothrix sp. AW2]|nr:hypothetical protein [Candidatus Electrothrix gigas]
MVFGKEKIIEKKLQQECHKSDLIAMEKVFFGLLVRATVGFEALADETTKPSKRHPLLFNMKPL